MYSNRLSGAYYIRDIRIKFNALLLRKKEFCNKKIELYFFF